MIVALLTAAGSSTRMNNNIPKQFIHVNDKPLILYTLEAFQKHPSIDAICITVDPDWKKVLISYAEQYKITKLKHIVFGGSSGQESIHNGLNEIGVNYPHKDTIVTIHDGNRPLITTEIISDSLAVYNKHGSAVAAMPCVEAIFRSLNGRQSDISIPREELFRTQTPHTFGLDDLLWAYETAAKKGITNTTAACTLMNELGKTVYFSQGSERNIKITVQEDLDIFKIYLTGGDKI